MNLSDKVMHSQVEAIGGELAVKDIKEFIKKLKEMHEELINDFQFHTVLRVNIIGEFEERLNKLVGDKLI